MRIETGAQQLHARHLAHVQVEQDDIEWVALQDVLCLLAATAEADLIALVLQHAGATLAQRALVVYDEDANGCFDFRCELCDRGNGIGPRSADAARRAFASGRDGHWLSPR